MSPTPGRSTLITSAPMIGEQLRAGRPRLHVGEVEDAHAVERLAGLAPRLATTASAGRCRCALLATFGCRLLRLQLATLLGGFRLPPPWLSLSWPSSLCHLRSRVLSRHAREAGIQYFVASRLAVPAFAGTSGMSVVMLSPYFLRSALCGLRLPMRPLSLPAAGSITALISVGLPESIAALTARLSSSGVVALTPTPPKASIILS